jgi:hypothetical protein
MFNIKQLTAAQHEALLLLPSKGWEPDNSTLGFLLGEQAVSVLCRAQLGSEMWFVIEPDGYTHS